MHDIVSITISFVHHATLPHYLKRCPLDDGVSGTRWTLGGSVALDPPD